jgi:Dockerin type I domain
MQFFLVFDPWGAAMNSTFSVRSLLLLCPLLLQVAAPSQVQAQLVRTFRSAPGTVAMYTYHTGEYHTVPLPADVTMRFSTNDTRSLTALIHKPIIGDTAENFNYPIVHEFPMVVTGTSTDGRTFTGHLSHPHFQYMFEWTIDVQSSPFLRWEGQVGWTGGRVEVSKVEDAALIPIAPGDYNEDGTVDAADFIIWRKALGQSNMTPLGFLADGDGDGQVDQDDYNIWRVNYGETSIRGPLAAAGIPEPATWLMLVLAILPLFHAACRRASP